MYKLRITYTTKDDTRVEVGPLELKTPEEVHGVIVLSCDVPALPSDHGVAISIVKNGNYYSGSSLARAVLRGARVGTLCDLLMGDDVLIKENS